MLYKKSYGSFLQISQHLETRQMSTVVIRKLVRGVPTTIYASQQKKTSTKQRMLHDSARMKSGGEVSNH